MSDRSVSVLPDDLSLTELYLVNWVLIAVKARILGGEPSGQVIDHALEEVADRVSCPVAGPAGR